MQPCAPFLRIQSICSFFLQRKFQSEHLLQQLLTMASHGLRPEGTDGSDFGSRETIVPIYSIIVAQKRRFRAAYIIHLLLFVIMALKLLDSVLDYFGVLVPDLAELAIPEPHWWEFVWLSSTLSMWICAKSLESNSVTQMRIGLYLTGLLATVAVVTGLMQHFSDFLQYVREKETKNLWMDRFPIAVIWSTLR